MVSKEKSFFSFDANSKYLWLKTLSVGLGVLGIGLLIAILGFVLFGKR